jgi:ABC-type transport system substrate-binding protein
MTFHSIPRKALLLGLMAAALSTTAFTAPALADKVLTMSVPGNQALDNLDPRTLLTTNHQAVQIGIFDSLVRSKGADIAPAAAEKFYYTDDR